MPKSDHTERRIMDYPRKGIALPDAKKFGKPPFTDEKSARRYLLGIRKFNEEDIQRLLKWYLPTLYPCGCPDPTSDKWYGLGNRVQIDCGSFYRCSKCGEERNRDGSKHIRQYRSDVDVKEEKLDSEQLSLLDWKEDLDND